MEILTQRLYSITSFYCNGIISGIQSYHSGMEYAVKYWETPEFQQWIKQDKTVIILSGGDSHVNDGTMEQLRDKLISYDIEIGVFHEPGMNDALTSISFLADEKVWDKEKYPDTNHSYPDVPEVDVEIFQQLDMRHKYGAKRVILRNLLKDFKLAN